MSENQLDIKKKYIRSSSNRNEELFVYHTGKFRYLLKLHLREEIIVSDEEITLEQVFKLLNEGNWHQIL